MKSISFKEKPLIDQTDIKLAIDDLVAQIEEKTGTAPQLNAKFELELLYAANLLRSWKVKFRPEEHSQGDADTYSTEQVGKFILVMMHRECQEKSIFPMFGKWTFTFWLTNSSIAACELSRETTRKAR